MKKILFSVTMALCSLMASAQVVIPVSDGPGMFRQSGEKIVVNGSQPKTAQPKAAASLDDTTLWGYYLGSIDYCGAVGIGAAATYWVGYFVPGDGVLNGSTINGVNIPVYTAYNMANMTIWISEDLETNVFEQEVKPALFQQLSYNAVALDEPYEIPEEGVFVGVKFTISKVVYQGDAYPILFSSDSDVKNSMVMKFSNAQGTDDWADYSSQFGSYAMQLYCANLNLADRNAYFGKVNAPYSTPGAEATTTAVVMSDGNEPVNSIDYTVEINGTTTTHHLDLDTPIPAGLSKNGTVEICFTSPEEYGPYTVNLTIDKVNGEDNAASEKVTTVTGKVISKIVPRRTVVEEFTGTGCQFCPRGWLGMEALKETRENFIGIAFHKYNSSDPMYVANYYPTGSLGISGAPGCAMDRKLLGIDPYYGSSESILDDFDACVAVTPEVDVTVAGEFNDDYTAVNMTADLEYLSNGGKYTVAFVLTADSLSGTTSAWRQTNYYASTNPTGDPLLDQFCRGGIYGSSSVYLVFNDVMIGSSYTTAGANQAPALTGEVVVGSMDKATYTVPMPTKATLKEAIHLDEVYAVALVIAADGTIANAARAKVTGYNPGTGIATTAPASGSSAEAVRYNLAGQRIETPQQGLNIVRHADGTTTKVLVK